jgi:predicted CDP-diglyceride synthetase/phosphatidate cytidylyltransferase
MRGDGGDVHRQTLVKAYGRGEEDVRDWTGAVSGNGGILKRVDVEQSYP